MKLLPALRWTWVAAIVAVLPCRADELNGLRSSICRAGDVNGDGVPDLMVASRDLPNRGSVWILSGKDGAIIRVVEGREACSRFGAWLAQLSDLNRDGVPDLAVGCRGAGCEPTSHYARVFSGRDGKLLLELTDGWIVVSIDDVDEDGTSDLLVGDPDRPGHTKTPVVTARSGRDGHVLYTVEPPGPSGPHCEFGSSFALLGDIDADGMRDYAVGSLGPCTSAEYRGWIGIYSGGGGTLLAEARGVPDAGLGWSLASIEDLDDDGHPDLLAGALHRYVDVLSGKDLHRLSRDRSRGGFAICDAFGSSLDRLGDVDFDCVPDWIVGANEYASMFDEGYARVLSGRTGRELWIGLQGEEGVDVCGVDDVDADGVPDFALSTESKWHADSGRPPPDGKLPPQQTQSIQLISSKDWRTLWTTDLCILRKEAPVADRPK